jgi:hypothetical protein
MFCGRCCVMELPSSLALRLDIFIEILLQRVAMTLNREARGTTKAHWSTPWAGIVPTVKWGC